MFKRILLLVGLFGLLFVLISCVRPVASFQAPNEIVAGEEAVFDASLSIGIDFFDWDFGDGTELLKTEERVVKHIYNQEGDYTVRLKARNLSFSWNQGEPDCMTQRITVISAIPPGPTPCDRNPVVTISLSSSKIKLGESITVIVTATDPTGGLIDWVEAVVTSPSGEDRDISRVTGGHLQFTVVGDEEDSWHILATCKNSCSTQEMTATAFANFVVEEDTPSPPTCQNPTLQAKVDGNYVSNNSTLQRETGDSISLRIEAEDTDDCGPCGTNVDGITIIRIHVWKGNQSNTVYSWDTSQGTLSLSSPYKAFSLNSEGTYGVDILVQDDDCDIHREAELHFLIEVDDPYVPPPPPEYRLDISNLTRPSGPNYTCHQIEAVISMISGEPEGPMKIRWRDGDESPGLIGVHQYREANVYVIQALNGVGEVVAETTINIQFRECVAPEIEIISAPLSDALLYLLRYQMPL